MKHVEVVAGIIFYDDEILCMKRPKGRHDYTSLKYEFPGGKIEIGESEQQALKRELMEEMELEVEIKEPFLVVNHTYPDFSLTMHSYICRVDKPNFVMKEHVDYKWLQVQELDELVWADADKPIVEKLMSAVK